MVGGGGGGIPSDYLVSTQLQLWLFCCWGCGCCWAVTISPRLKLCDNIELMLDDVLRSLFNSFTVVGWVAGLMINLADLSRAKD